MTVSLYAALLAALFIFLSVNIIRNRRALKLALGHANHHGMQRRLRAHGNFAEYTPIFLIMLGLAEYQGLPVFAVHLAGIVFLYGRMSHAYGLLRAEHYENDVLISGSRYRVRGMACTFTSLAFLAAILLIQYARMLFS